MCSSGTDETIRRLVEAYSLMLLRLAAARLSSPADAEDVVQAGRTFTITPLVAGHPPRSVNIFSMNESCASFLQSGTAYYAMDTKDIQIFADRTVYLTVYQGAVPSYQQFSVAEDGTVAMREEVVEYMFPLPLDPALADSGTAASLRTGRLILMKGRSFGQSPATRMEKNRNKATGGRLRFSADGPPVLPARATVSRRKRVQPGRR